MGSTVSLEASPHKAIQSEICRSQLMILIQRIRIYLCEKTEKLKIADTELEQKSQLSPPCSSVLSPSTCTET